MPAGFERRNLTGLWMVPYADMMSTLVILFLALFSYAYANRSPEFERALARMQKEVAGKTEERAAARKVQETELAVKIKAEMDRLALEDFGLKVDSRYVHLTLPEPVLFSPGSAELNKDAARVLRPLAGLFSGLDHPVLVEGHTDDRPVRSRWRNNWELSAARAYSVIEFMIGQGLRARRFHARGHGEHRPLGSNLTPEGRRRNRRIEITLVRGMREEAASRSAPSPEAAYRPRPEEAP